MERILFVIPTLNRGGSERQLTYLVKNLDPQKFDPVIVCTLDLGEWGNELLQSGYKVIPLHFPKGHDPRIAIEIAKIISDYQINIVQSFLFGMDLLATWPAYFKRVGKIIVARRELAGWMTSKHKFIARWGGKAAKIYTANSNSVAQKIIEQEEVPWEKIVVIPNGVECPAEMPEHSPDPNEIFRIFCLANFSPVKGHRDLINAIGKLKNNNIILTCFGDGPLLEDMKKLVKKKNLSEKIIFAGTYDNPNEVLKDADLLVVPSHEEGSPNVILEAMASGVPVIGTAVGGIPELLGNGLYGVLVSPHSPKDMALSIEQISQNPEFRIRLAKKAFKTVKEKYTIENMVKNYELLYNTEY